MEWIKKEEGQYQVSTVAAEVDLWLQYTGWEKVVAISKHDLVATAVFTNIAAAAKPELERVLQSWERILQHSLNMLAAVGNYKDILKWWASPKNKAASQRPFERPEKKSIGWYSQIFARLLCYIIRTTPEYADEESETSVTFLELQLKWVKNVWKAAAIAGADNSNELDTALIGLIISLLAQDTSQLGLYESLVMYYLAICSINVQTKTFFLSFRYTPILAHMIWIIRLLMLEVAISEQGWPELGLQSRKEIGAIAGAVRERVYELRQGHLYEGSFSPASSILSQLALDLTLRLHILLRLY